MRPWLDCGGKATFQSYPSRINKVYSILFCLITPPVIPSRSVQDTLTLNQTSLTQHQHSASVEDRIVQVVTAAGLASNLDTTLLRAADYLPNALCSDKGEFGFDSPPRSELYSKRIRFVLGTAGFPLSCLLPLFANE
jgi:hypothetical protein